MDNKDRSAFPLNKKGVEPEWGLTKREHFAGIALQGLLANPTPSTGSTDDYAAAAVRYGDALIEALGKMNPPQGDAGRDVDGI